MQAILGTPTATPHELIVPELRDPFECHCPDCQWRFRDFLKKRYASLAAGLFWIDNPHPDVGIVPHLTKDKRWYFNHGRADREVNGIVVPAGDFVVA